MLTTLVGRAHETKEEARAKLQDHLDRLQAAHPDYHEIREVCAQWRTGDCEVAAMATFWTVIEADTNPLSPAAAYAQDLGEAFAEGTGLKATVLPPTLLDYSSAPSSR